MKLEYKNTLYDLRYKKSASSIGLKDNDFWIDVNLKIKNEDIDYDNVISGISLNELKKWIEMDRFYLEVKMPNKRKLTFIKRFGEFFYYPDKHIVKNKLYLFGNLNKYYTVRLNDDEVKANYMRNVEFVEKNGKI